MLRWKLKTTKQCQNFPRYKLKQNNKQIRKTQQFEIHSLGCCGSLHVFCSIKKRRNFFFKYTKNGSWLIGKVRKICQKFSARIFVDSDNDL